MMSPFKAFACLIVGALALVRAGANESPVAPSVQFGRDIRPILSDACFACHGPDEATREAGLRLDTREGAVSSKDGVHIILPGNADQSELLKRITAHDPDDRMPPAKTGKQLSERQIDLLRTWINEGAPWDMHWAFEKPVRPEVPEVKNKSWPRNEIDKFILARLEKEGLEPSPEASEEDLMRRATLDLTGLPPSIEEMDAFLADDRPEAYDHLVDRLLNSSRYGEQMARYWLDSARYADSHGYHIDAPRMVWKYREWVINAFNENKPFDEFTIEQIAGDMLPDATLEQKVASGFNRCNMSTGEGGAIEDEYRVKYAADRVETVGTVWMGLTVGCAQCHTHKYDPITHEEFYKMAAIFNNIAEPALDGNQPAPPPSIKVPTEEQAAELKRLDQLIAGLKKQLEGPNEKLDAAQAEWESEWRGKLLSDFKVLTPTELSSPEGATFEVLDDQSILVQGNNADRDTYEVVVRTGPQPIAAIRLEALLHDSLPHKSAARSENGNFVLTDFQVEATPLADPSRKEPIRFAAAIADFAQDKFPATFAIDGDSASGWAADGHNRRENRTLLLIPESAISHPGGTELRIRLAFHSPFPKHSIGRFRLATAVANDGLRLVTPLQFTPWHAIGPFTAASGDAAFKTEFGPEQSVDFTKTYRDGKLQWTPKPEFKDGQANNLSGENCATYLYRTIRSPFPRTLQLRFGSDDAIKAWLNGELILDQNVQRGVTVDGDKVTVTLKPGENHLLLKVVNYGTGYAFSFSSAPDPAEPISPDIVRQLVFSGEQQDEAGRKLLRNFYRETFVPEHKEKLAQLRTTEEDRKKLNDAIPMTMVSKELEKPRDTHILIRGEYDKKGALVSPGVPAVLPPLPAAEQTNRLVFAQWLVDEENPLTARVTVNRFWQRYFGTGLVKTAQDFGAQGDAPSHPELLDWLAVEFMQSGWDIGHIQRLIVTSATYRQSSKLSPELLELDPENRLLARGPRFRMDAEMVRDNALALAGLLVEKIGGPSVKPYQPPGLWTEVSYGFNEDYIPDKGEGLYRRSMYTYWKRQSPPPGMTTLDAPSREVCTVKRPRTNTPLQALMLMNDPQYVEASRGLASRMMTEPGCNDADDRIAFAYRLATARQPSEEQIALLREAYQTQLQAFQENRDAAVELLEVGEKPINDSLDPAELAAWTTVANIILNLDATITKS